MNIKISKEKIILFTILILAAFLRFYNLRQGMHYMGDEGRDVLIAKDIINGKNYPFVGPATSVGKLYLGPLYFYLVAPFLWLFGMDPIGPAVFIVLLSLATVVVIFVTAKDMFDKTAALWAALFYSISPMAVEYGRWPWNPNVMPFFATIFIYSLWQVFEKKREKWIIIAGASLAAILQSHYLGLAAIPVFIVCFLIKKPKITLKKYWLFGGLIFLLLMLPLLAFDLKHDFLNTKGFLEIVLERKSGGFSLIDPLSRARDRIRQIFGDFSGLGERSLANNMVIFGGLASWGILTKKRKDWWLLGAWIIIGALFMGFYQGSFHQHYLEFLLPAAAIFFGAILSLFWQKKYWHWFGLGIGIVFFGALFSQSVKIASYERIPNAETTKKIVRFIGEESQGKPFNFSLLAENNYDSAYRYFFDVWHMPAEYTDIVTRQLFVVCEGEKICQPQGNPKWEIAVFDGAYNGKIKLAGEWSFYEYLKVYKFIPQNL